MTEVELSKPEKHILAAVYQMSTSNLATEYDTEESVMLELINLKSYLRTQAMALGLVGILAGIHSALIIEELDDANVYDLALYADIMRYKIPDHIRLKETQMEIAQYLLQQMQQFREGLRIHAYQAKCFFAKYDEKLPSFPGILYWERCPTMIELQNDGIECHYPMIGALTDDTLVERFNFRELAVLATLLNAVRVEELKSRYDDPEDYPENTFKLKGMMHIKDITGFIIFCLDDLRLDPRGFVTPLGPEILVVEDSRNATVSINDSNFIEYNDLIEVASSEGIVCRLAKGQGAYKPYEVLWEEYTVSQLSETFIASFGEHRCMLDAIQSQVGFNDITLCSGERVSELSDVTLANELVYYGLRDGVSKVRVYSFNELNMTFSELQDVYEPHSVRLNSENVILWKKFSRRSIQRLLKTVLPMKKHSQYFQKLTNTIVQILRRSNISDVAKKLQLETIALIIGTTDEKRTLFKSALVMMHRTGNMLDDDHILSPDNPDGFKNNNAKSLIMILQDRISRIGEESTYLNRLPIIKEWYGQQFFSYEDPSYHVGNYLEIMLSMAKLGLFRSLKQAGIYLKSTAVGYYRAIFDYDLLGVVIEYEYTSAVYEEETKDAMLEDYSVPKE